MSDIRLLQGMSGCSVFKIKDKEGHYFVRKVSSCRDYNQRMERQCEKQRILHDQGYPTPEVLKFGWLEKGLFYFDMPFIEGVNLAEFIATSTTDEIELTVCKGLLESFILKEKKSTLPTSVNINEIFQRKASSLKNKIPQTTVTMSALTRILMMDYSRLRRTICHGDLSAENVIVGCDGKLYFIDLLDSFADSWLMDLSKIIMDLQIKWSWRNSRTFCSEKVSECLYSVNSRINHVLSSEDRYYCQNLVLLHMLRILPYVKIGSLEYNLITKGLEKNLEEKDLL